MKKRVMFVDDEPKVLRGLERMLFDLSDEWDMTFLGCGADALAALDTDEFDVIVSDMRMPGMDGRALLSQTKERHPGVIRIVLTGQTDEETAFRTIPVVQRFLRKPCDPSLIKDTLGQVGALRELLNNTQVREIVGRTGKLPTTLQVYTELTRAISDPDVSMRYLASIVERDAGITARVLQVVNSPAFGSIREISDVQSAMVHLGIGTIRSVALCMEAFDRLRMPARAGFSFEAEYAHSIKTAYLSRRLIGQERGLANTAFTVGLMHDIGRMVMAKHCPDYMERLQFQPGGCESAILASERDSFGVTHAEVGAYLLGTWDLPHVIVDGIAYHHDPRSGGERTFGITTAVHVADNLLQAETAGSSVDDIDILIDEMGMTDQLPRWRAAAHELSTHPRESWL